MALNAIYLIEIKQVARPGNLVKRVNTVLL